MSERRNGLGECRCVRWDRSKLTKPPNSGGVGEERSAKDLSCECRTPPRRSRSRRSGGLAVPARFRGWPGRRASTGLGRRHVDRRGPGEGVGLSHNFRGHGVERQLMAGRARERVGGPSRSAADDHRHQSATTWIDAAGAGARRVRRRKRTWNHWLIVREPRLVPADPVCHVVSQRPARTRPPSPGASTGCGRRARLPAPLRAGAGAGFTDVSIVASRGSGARGEHSVPVTTGRDRREASRAGQSGRRAGRLQDAPLPSAGRRPGDVGRPAPLERACRLCTVESLRSATAPWVPIDRGIARTTLRTAA